MLTPSEARDRWRGVAVPLATFFAQDRSLDLDATAAHVRWLMDKGARQGNTVFLTATAGGDFSSMNLRERMDVIRTTVDVVAGRVPLIAGAQSTDVRETIEICQLCEDLGVDAVQISGPYYYDGRPGDVLAWMEEVARHTKVGFALYNNWYTGYNMPLDLVERLLDIPNSVGMKWSAPDSQTFDDGMQRFMDRVAMVDNSLQMPLKTHMMGCRAFINMVPNFFPEVVWSFWELMEQGRYPEARIKWDALMVPYTRLTGQIRAITNGDGILIRAAMRAAGIPAGTSRLPSRDDAITPEIHDGLCEFLAEVHIQ
jgi:dihydrodipicolinate synthase/N-acetylneuraminate lyase